MAYSPIEQAFINARVEEQFPTEPEQPMMLADAGTVKTDAPQDYGSITPIKQSNLEKVMEETGLTLEQIGNALEALGKVSVGGMELSLRDFVPFVGSVEDGKVTGTPAALQAAGRGEGLTRGSGWATQMTQDAKLAALDVATAGVAKPAAKIAKKIVKKKGAVAAAVGATSPSSVADEEKK